MNKALILFLTFCFTSQIIHAQSIFETNNKISAIPILDGDYGGLIIPNAGIGLGYSRICNRKFEVEITAGYKVGILNDDESYGIVRVVQADFDRLAFKRVTEIGINLKSYLFNSFGSVAPVGTYTQVGLQRSLIHLIHYDLVRSNEPSQFLDQPRFAKARTIDLTLGIGKSVPWRSNIVVSAYGGISFPIALKFIEFNDDDQFISSETNSGINYYRSFIGGNKMYIFLNNGFQVRFSIAKAF